jgi:hypothetical protein
MIVVDADSLRDGPAGWMDKCISGDDQSDSALRQFFIKIDKGIRDEAVDIGPFLVCGRADHAVLEVDSGKREGIEQFHYYCLPPSEAASFIASIRLDGSAMPFHAIS